MDKLEAMLKYVSEHNDFYKKRIAEYGISNPLDITQWPILTRKELQENRYNMFSDGYRTKYFNQQLRRQSSSGSSGMPVNVYWDYKDWYASNMSLWRKRWQWHGIKPSDKYVMFTLNAFDKKADGRTIFYVQEPSNLLLINTSLVHSEVQYRRIIEMINTFEPKWLYIQPYLLRKIIQTHKKYSLKVPSSIQYIESVGEVLNSVLRHEAEEIFNVQLVNMYGSEEMNGIAYENPNHYMQICSENVFVETKNENTMFTSNDVGTAIITNLNNYAMPLIRYDQGDIIELEEKTNNDSCNGCLAIKSIKGRKIEQVHICDECIVTAYTLNEIISETNNTLSDIIISGNFVYHRIAKMFECYIELCYGYEDWFETIRQQIEEIFYSKTQLPKQIGIIIHRDNDSLVSNMKPPLLSVVD